MRSGHGLGRFVAGVPVVLMARVQNMPHIGGYVRANQRSLVHHFANGLQSFGKMNAIQHRRHRLERTQHPVAFHALFKRRIAFGVKGFGMGHAAGHPEQNDRIGGAVVWPGFRVRLQPDSRLDMGAPAAKAAMVAALVFCRNSRLFQLFFMLRYLVSYCAEVITSFCRRFTICHGGYYSATNLALSTYCLHINKSIEIQGAGNGPDQILNTLVLGFLPTIFWATAISFGMGSRPKRFPVQVFHQRIRRWVCRFPLLRPPS